MRADPLSPQPKVTHLPLHRHTLLPMTWSCVCLVCVCVFGEGQGMWGSLTSTLVVFLRGHRLNQILPLSRHSFKDYSILQHSVSGTLKPKLFG